jgi:polyferredoxin
MNRFVPVIRYLFLALFIVLMILGRIQLWLIIYGAGVILSFFFGRIYCGYVCPMNTLMRPVQHVSRKIGIQQKRVPRWLENLQLPYVLLAIALGSMFIGKRIFSITVPVLPLVFATSLLVTLFLPSRIWHNSLCPYSLLLRWGGRKASYAKRVSSDVCIGCAKCQKVCPAGAITVSGKPKKAQIDQRLCHQCESCTAVCPTSAISYTS